jgi:hypothetical protein
MWKNTFWEPHYRVYFFLHRIHNFYVYIEEKNKYYCAKAMYPGWAEIIFLDIDRNSPLGSQTSSICHTNSGNKLIAKISFCYFEKLSGN